MTTGATAILRLSCPDQRGIVAKTASFIAAHSGNVIHADQHIDTATGLFLMRLEWELEGFSLPRDTIASAFTPLGEELHAWWKLEFSDDIPRVAIFASKQEHCLADLILRMQHQDIRAIPAVVVSNHAELEPLTQQLGVQFFRIPTTATHEHEQQQLQLLTAHNIDLVVLAKYMQILTPTFLTQAPPIINIHHSFLPAFVGAHPYHQAWERGVKVIGATAHYVTEELDAGPIIDQDVLRVSHRDAAEDFVLKGKDLERIVLARAVRAHCERRIVVHGNRTSVFD